MDNECPECDGYGVTIISQTDHFLEVELCSVCDGDGLVPWFSNSCIPGDCE